MPLTPLSQLLSDRASELGMSQAEIARRLHQAGQTVSPAAVSHWMQGISAPSPERWHALALVLGLRTQDILTAATAPAPVAP